MDTKDQTPKDLESLLSTLQAQAIEGLLKKIQSGEASAADYTAALNYLKHNNIQVQPGANKDLEEIRDTLNGIDDGSFPFPVREAHGS